MQLSILKLTTIFPASCNNVMKTDLSASPASDCAMKINSSANSDEYNDEPPSKQPRSVEDILK